MKIQMRIEAMRREYDFISKLDTNDVGYVLQKKREQAAIMIQRKFRMQKAKRELRDRRAGLYKKEDDEELLLTASDLARVKEHSEELRHQRTYVNEQFVDGFYKKIPEDRKRELINEVVKRRKLVTESELRAYRCEDLLNEYQVKYQHF